MSNISKINSKTLLKGDSKIASGETKDCVVYAISTAFQMSYDEAHKEVADRFNRQDGKGTSRNSILEGMTEGTAINGKTVSKVIKSPTKTYKVYGNVVPRQLRLSSFIKNNQEGTYVILTKGHALTIKDGTIMDNLDRTKERALVEVAFKID